jgi:hypothetical protein
MVIEKFKTPGALEIYDRVRDKGRLIPLGLEYVSSWVDLKFTVCFQIMRTEDESLFDLWVDQWKDLVDFEIIPIQTSIEAREKISK